MTSNDSTNIDTPQFQFPLWLEEIVPVKCAISYINNRGLENDVDDILSVACQRLENAKNKGMQIFLNSSLAVLSL